MTDEFKKGLATGLAIGGISINKASANQIIQIGNASKSYYAKRITSANIIIGKLISTLEVDNE